MQRVTITKAALGRDPQMRYTPNGQAVADFSVAVNEGTGERKRTVWFKVTVWGKLAETCNQYLKKGRKVNVIGRLEADERGNPRLFDRNDGSKGCQFEITANEVEFADSASGGEGGEGGEAAASEEEIPWTA